MGFQPVHIVAEYDGKIVSKSCRKKLRILNTLPFGVGLAHEALFGNVQKINSAGNLRSRASDDELKINSNRKIAEVF